MDEIDWGEKIVGLFCLSIYAKLSKKISKKGFDKLKHIGTAL